MKVLLVNPFLTVLPDDPAGINPSLSLAYLAGWLEEKKVAVAVLDIAAEGANQITKVGQKKRYGLDEKEIIKKIKAYQPKIVGLTCSSTLHAQDAYQTARIIKKADPKILIVMGGAHPSVAPQEVLQDSKVDMVVRGEGEITFGEIVSKFRGNKIPQGILGTSVRQGKKIINYPPRPLIKNLDLLPFPARHLLPMETYFRQKAEGTNYSIRNRGVTMITSRGCPGRCVYCAIKSIWGRVWRPRSPKNVVDEIEALIKDFGVNEIDFVDDNLSVDRKRLTAICDEIIRRKLDIKWTASNGLAVWQFNKRLLLKMKQAGCYRLTFGLESGNKEILRHYIGKPYDYCQASKIIKYASQIGFWTASTFIIGFPYETREQIEETIDFAITADLDLAVFYIANPFPGTLMYEDYQKEGLLPKTGAYKIVRGCRSKYFSHHRLVEFQAEAFSRFMKSRLKKPWRFLKKIKSFEDLAYTYKLGKNFLKIFINQTSVKKKGIAALWK